MADIQSIETTTIPPSVIAVWNGGLSDPALAVVNEYSVLSIPAFWCGVRFLSETLASLPKAVYRMDDEGRARRPVRHPLNALLSRKSNAFQTPFVAFETFHSHSVVHGNGYLIIERDERTQRPVGLHNMNPLSVTPFRYDGAQYYWLRGQRGKDGKPKNLALHGSDVCHLPGLGFDGMTGFPVVWLMYEALELARNNQRFASKYLRRGTQVQGSIEIPGSATKEQVDQIRERLRSFHAGIESDYNHMILTGGASLKNATIPPEQSQLLQSRQFSVVDMCRILRIPPHIVYDLSRATWANVESMGIEVVKYSLRPWVEKSEQELSLKLLTEEEHVQGLHIRYSVDSLLRGDTATTTSTTLSLVNGGIITANEGRAALDLPPMDDPTADQLRIPVNFPVPTVTPPADPKPVQPPSNDDQDFSALRPIIEDACARVESKTAKAFAAHPGIPVPWGNIFAEEQSAFTTTTLGPVAATLASLGFTLDAQGIGQQYAQIVRSRAAVERVPGNQPRSEITPTLLQIVTNALRNK